MTIDEALDVVVARTGHERYRFLCADDHPNREGYRRAVMDMAARFVESDLPLALTSTSEQRPTVSAAWRALRLGLRACLYASHAGSCGCPYCWYVEKKVSLADCLACLPPPTSDPATEPGDH